MGQYEHHIFVCTSGKTCGTQGGPEVFKRLKDCAADAGLKGIVRVNQAGCMNQCGHGPMVVVYPSNVWYCGVDEAGAERIIAEHIVGGAPVEELLYIAPTGDNKLKD